VELVAGHLMAVTPAANPWRVQVLREAAQEALARGAPDSAVCYLRQAQVEAAPTSPAGCRAELAADLSGAELHVDLRACLRRLSAVVRADGDAGADGDGGFLGPGQSARAVLPLVHGLLTANFAEAVELFAELRRQLDADPGRRDGGPGERDLAARLGAQLLLAGHPDAEPLTARFAPPTTAQAALDPAERGMLAVLTARAAAFGGPAGPAVELAERCLTAEPGGLGDGSSQVPLLAVLGLIWADRFDDAARWCDQAVEGAGRSGSLTMQALALWLRSELAFRRGQLGQALDDANRALHLAEASHAHGFRAAATAFAARVLAEQGHLEAAADTLEADGVAAAASGAHRLIHGQFLDVRGQLSMARGQPHAALRDFLDCGRQLTSMRIGNPACLPWRSHAALAAATLGDSAHARRLAAEELALARAWGAPRAIGVALAAAGAVEEPCQALNLLYEAVDVLGASPARLDHARALVRLGVELHRQDHGYAARDALRRGLLAAYDCGATVLMEHARGHLIAAGGRLRRDDLERSPSLTAAQLRAAELAAEGRSNAEIAASLEISRRTVEVHLARAYRKLGISSRAGLLDALTRLEGERGRVLDGDPALAAVPLAAAPGPGVPVALR